MELESGFEAKLREALLADVEDQLLDLVEEFVELVHTRLRSYAKTHGYDVESTIDSVGDPQVDRNGETLVIRVGWESEQMARWEFGTSDHTVRGDPLSFVWKDPPQWVREEFDQARDAGGQFESGYRVFLPETNVSGVQESRAIRDSLNGLRRLLRA